MSTPRGVGVRPHELLAQERAKDSLPTEPTVDAIPDAKPNVLAEIRDVLQATHKSKEGGKSVDFEANRVASAIDLGSASIRET